jgi:hypothetical protein
MRPRAYTCCLGALMLGLAGCATVSLTPQSIRPPDPVFANSAIEAEPTAPAQVAIRDFEFSPSVVTENRSLFHHAFDLFRSSTAQQRRIAIGRQAAAAIARQAAKRLDKTGLPAVRIPAESDVPLQGNVLLVNGRLTEVNEGNRFTRVALGLGMGESFVLTEVHVYRVVNDQRAEVLAFTTRADSGRMPGIFPSLFTLGIGQIALAPVTTVKVVKDAASGGMKVYSSQVNHLASQTGDQVARYLSQYAAAQHWIAQDKARRPHYAG